MKLVWIAVVMLVACGDDDLAKRKAAMDRAAKADQPAAPAPKPADTPKPAADTPAARPATPKEPEPDPNDAAAIEHARNQAMIDGRDKDVLHYCELGKLDDKSNPQALLGCTLAACRLKDADSAHKYGKPLAKAYRDNANRVCSQSQIVL